MSVTVQKRETLKNGLLRLACRAYPFSKGRYRLMKLCERWVDRDRGVRAPYFGPYQLLVDLDETGLQSSFYYFIPSFYERQTQRFIGDSLKPGMTVVDIGAHHGLMTILMADRVGKTGRVFAFEPASKNYERLEENVRFNGLSQVRTIYAAAAEYAEEAVLVHGASDACHQIKLDAHEKGANGKFEMVRTMPLDDLADREKIETIHLLKIDAEESEFAVLEGAKKLLSQGRVTNIVCEIHCTSSKVPAGNDSVRKKLYDYGYRSYVLNSALAKKPYLSEYRATEPVTGLQNFLFKK